MVKKKKLYHTSRKENMCVDYLAKLVTRFTNDLMIVLDLRVDFRLLFMADIMGAVYHWGQ